MIGGNLWRHPDFLKLWSGETISVLGTEVSALAIPTLAVLQLHATPFQIGLLVALERVPFPILALFVGGVVDRMARRPVMVAADIARLLILAAVPVSAALGLLSLGELYAVALSIGICTVFFDVAYLAYLPSLVSRENLLEGNTKLEMSYSVGAVAGPGLAGLLIQLLGAATAVAVDAGSYLVSATNLLLIPPERQKPAPESRPHLLREIGEGLHVDFRDPVLRSLILTFGALVAGSHAVEAIQLPFAYRRLHLSPGALGVALSLAGIGSIAGSLVGPRAVALLGMGRAISSGEAISGAMLLGLPLALVLPPLPVLITLFFFASLGGTISNINQVSLRQAITPDRLHGRMNATFRTVFWGAWPLGNILGGIAAEQIGLVPTIFLGGSVAVLAALSILVTPLGRIKEPPTRVHDAL